MSEDEPVSLQDTFDPYNNPIWAVVPVKPLESAKSRLGGVLSPDERMRLVLAMLDQTLAVLANTYGLAGQLVVSADARILEVGRKHGAHGLLEAEASGLNRSVWRASLEVMRRGAAGMLVVPIDLPLINPASLEQVLQPALRPPVVVIVPDQYRQGTNVLLAAPPNIIHFRFGSRSFQKHQEAARQAGAKLFIIESERLGVDVDCPEQIELVRHLLE